MSGLASREGIPGSSDVSLTACEGSLQGCEEGSPPAWAKRALQAPRHDCKTAAAVAAAVAVAAVESESYRSLDSGLASPEAPVVLKWCKRLAMTH